MYKLKLLGESESFVKTIRIYNLYFYSRKTQWRILAGRSYIGKDPINEAAR